MLDRLDTRVADVLARAQRGADVGGLLGPLEQDAARAERDLIVGASNRRADAHDEARARALRAELEARGAALRDLAARCVAQVAPAPRLAVPDVSALGPVPTDPAAVDAYLVRLDAVGPGDDDGPGRLRLARWPSATSCRRAPGGVRRQGRRPALVHPVGQTSTPRTSRSSSGAPARRSTVSRPTSSAPAPSSRPTWPTWAAPSASRTERTPNGGGTP